MSSTPGSRTDGLVLLLLGGAISTGLALAGVYFAQRHGTNLMGWYANYVIPAGAMLVGIVASSGFGLSSWYTGTKITRAPLAAVVAILVVGYFVAKYLEYRQLVPGGALDDGTSLGFWTYFDLTTRAFRWAPKYGGQPGEPFGTLGYAMRGLEITGFALGGLVAPLVLRHKPYCESCQRYRRTRTLAWVPASVAARKVGKRDLEGNAALHAEHEAAFQAGASKIQDLMTAAAAGDAIGLRAQLASAGPSRVAQKLPTRIAVEIVHCRSCADGLLRARSFSGHGKHIVVRNLAETKLSPATVAALVGSSKLPAATLRSPS
jgi:hypothetical protein